MRSGFSVLLIVVLLFTGGYFYNFAQAVCPVPLHYRIGALDERFGMTLEEARVAVSEAAEVWEEPTGQNLFTYDETADFTINFIYDERQATVEAEERFSDKLDSAKDVNDAITDTYDNLTAEYEALKVTHQRLVASYESRLSAYNAQVQQYNNEGGAPPEAFAELEAERDALADKRVELNTLGAKLNQLVDEINHVGDRGNALIENYNENVGEFNERFGGSREFTQGDYRGDHINIYTFKDDWELQTVLAHELGHALSLDHIEGESSIMHYLMGAQPTEVALGPHDIEEFNRVCGDMSLWDKIIYRLEDNH